MVNTTAKGNRIENYAAKILEAQGYVIHKTQRTMRNYGKGSFGSGDNDVFNCVDIIAKKKGERTRWIQVKSTNKKGEVVKKYSVVPWDENYDSPEYWLWFGGRGKMYFQIYYWEEDWKLIKDDNHRVDLSEVKE